jgi:adenosylmethionine-8-amino-7-oxononanoate aminotransferase
LIVMGKGMAAGYAPLAGVLIGDRVYEAIKQGSRLFFHGHTHSFNPISASAGLAVLRYIEANKLPQNVLERGAQLRAGLEELATRHDVIGEVRGRGLMLAIELVSDRSSRTPLSGGPLAPYKIAGIAKQFGLLVYPAGTGSTSVLLTTPPFTITAEEVKIMLELLDETLTAFKRKI